jgi:hypothetical protein
MTVHKERAVCRTCLPSLMLATAMVILRVTKISPRRGDSWLNRIPLQQNMLYASLYREHRFLRGMCETSEMAAYTIARDA